MRVYADNAATTKLSPAAKEAMLPYFDEIYGNPSTLYTLGQEAAEHLLACRTEIAQLIGRCDPREIVFTSGGSEADNQAIISAARNGARKGKKHLISTKFEHHAVLHTLDKLRKEGFDVTLLDVHENGVVRVEDVAAAIRDDTALVSVMFANNEIGTIQPFSHRRALPRAGHPVPHGRGAGCRPRPRGRAGDAHRPALVLGAQIPWAARRRLSVRQARHPAHEYHRGRRAGTRQAGRHGEHPRHHGLAAALEESCGHIDEDTARLTKLRDKLIAGLSKIPTAR